MRRQEEEKERRKRQQNAYKKKESGNFDLSNTGLNDKFPEDDEEKSKPVEKVNEETIIEEQATLRLLLCTTQANYEWEQIGRKWNKILKRLILHSFLYF